MVMVMGGLTDVFQQYASAAAGKMGMGLQNNVYSKGTVNDRLLSKKNELVSTISNAEEQLQMVNETLEELTNNKKMADLLDSLSKFGVI
jgi:hypothetical protein